MGSNSFQGKIESIQLLRIIAATGIVLFHIQCFYSTGLYLEFGVHLFFVISAFLMMYTTQNIPKKHFVLKRLLRIVPLYWILTIATFALIKMFPDIVTNDGSIQSLICSLFFVPYTRDGIRGFGAIRPLVGPAWTLNYDILFTVIFSISMKISHKCRGFITAGVLTILLTCGMLLDIHFVPFFFWTRDYWIDFIAGIIAFYILKRLYAFPFSKITRNIFSSVAFGLIGIMCWGGFAEPRWLIFAVLSLATVVLLLLGLKNVNIPSALIKAGDISFSFYLIHYYVIVLVGKIFNLNSFGVKSTIGTILVFIMTYVCANLSYSILEVNFTNLVKRKLNL